MTNASVGPVSVLGLGTMGAAIAHALVAKGHPTTVWNRSPGRSKDLAAAGATVADSPADAAAASPLVLVCVLDQPAADEVLAAIGDEVDGRTVVNLASCTPDQARATAAWAEQRDAHYLDGSILADPENVGTAATSFLYSGSESAFEDHATTLGALGNTQFFGPDPGRAALYFIALVGLGYETWVAYLDTLALVGAEGVDAEAFAPFATGMFGSMTDLLTGWARAADDGRHPPAAGPLSVHAPLMDDVIRTRRQHGVDNLQMLRVKGLVERAVAEGHADDGFSSLIEVLR